MTDTVVVNIDVQASGLTREGFGTPLILTFHNRFTELFQVYENVADMISPTGPFQSSDAAVVLAQALKAQNPSVGEFIVGRRTTAPQRSVDLAFVAQNSTQYEVLVDGESATFTSDADATPTEIALGLASAINGLSITNLTVTNNGTTLTLASTAAGVPFTIESTDRRLVTVKDNTPAGAASDIPGDLAAIQALPGGDDWYAVTGDFYGEAEILEAAAYIEGQTKLMAVALQDDDILTAVTNDAASAISNQQLNRTFMVFDTDPHQGAAAAYLGSCLPQDPGTLTWKFRQLSGVDRPVPVLSAGEIAQLEAKNVNYLREESGLIFTAEGALAGGSNQFIDVTRTIDAIEARIREDVLRDIVTANKIPYDNRGIAIIENRVRAVLDFFVGQGALASDPAPTVTVPDALAVSTVDRANRLLPNVNFTARLAGAIHNVQISGTVTV